MRFLNHRCTRSMAAVAEPRRRLDVHQAAASSSTVLRVVCTAALLLATNLGAQSVPAKSADVRPPGSKKWVEQTLRRMSLREKLGQLFFYYLDTDFKPEGDPELQAIVRLVTQHQVGGLHLWRGEPYATAHLTNRLQALSKLPLLFTADLENGMARFRGTEFPTNMAIAATGNVDMAYEVGRHTAIEARALGIGLTFAPVVDINSNPENPIINVRAFGEEPETVARFAEAFLRGCRQEGLLTTAKHFPGHGDTRQDSHIELALIEADSARLEQLELVPFRRAIAAGVDFIMTAHVNVRGLNLNPYTPATLSSEILTKLLRERLQFDGVIITDAMHMWAITRSYTGAYATAAALNAGVDVILAQENIPELIADLERRVRAGEIAEARIEQSVRRILLAKTKIGLHQQRRVEPAAVAGLLQRPEALQAAEQAAAHSLTLLRNEGGVLPLAAGMRVVVVNLWDEPRGFNRTPFLRELERFVQPAAVVSLHPNSTAREVERARAAVRAAQIQVLPVYAAIGSWKGHIGLPQVMQPMVDSLLATGVPAAVISMGNPYVYSQVQHAAAYLVAYDDENRMSQAAARAVAGATAIAGRLPITIPGFFARGAGLTLAARGTKPLDESAALAPTLRMAFPEEAGMSKAGLDSVRALMQQAVRDSVFPGAVLLVARRGKIALHEAFGTLGYGAFYRPAPLHAIYDIASLTKVVGLTTACMLLYERGRLKLDEKVQTYLPEFTGKDKDKVTVRHLLTHCSGLVAFRLYYRDYRTPDAIVNTILREELEYPTGSKTVYSDLGAILLGKIVERLAGKPLDAFCREEIFAPLNMTDTFYNPPAALLPRIAPTEFDTWTEGRKGDFAHGIVHDENAWRLGGVSGHAGLFSSSRDLGVFLQMLLNGGSFGEAKLLQPETIALFTSRQEVVPGSSRALGWDTADGENSAGTLMSRKAYGHTGFTGTSLWTDPERGLIVVLLSNRVHPTRENRRILPFRAKLHDAVVRAITP